MDYSEELKFYRIHLTESLLPFWEKAYDANNGGIFTCFNNYGTELVCRDKFVWSQGRMAWVFAHIALDIKKGILPELDQKENEYLEKARKTCCFLRDNAILDDSDGVCAYLLTETGEKKESIQGRGYYTSFFVDCFVILGFSEYSIAASDREFAEIALALYDRTNKRLQRGDVVTEPYPIVPGFRSHAVDMIMNCTASNLANALKVHHHSRYEEISKEAVLHTDRILNFFYRKEYGLIQELKPNDETLEDTFSARHTMPGHALESMWFCIHTYEQNGIAVPEKIYQIAKNNLRIGWDKEEGGIFRCVDVEGGEPKGRRISGDPYETLMADTWDSKLWWTHAETLYVTLLCEKRTRDSFFAEYYEKTISYVRDKFINPDASVGEWIQILDRKGNPMDKLVALPVKDPFHIIRAVLLIIELLSDKL